MLDFQFEQSFTPVAEHHSTVFLDQILHPSRCKQIHFKLVLARLRPWRLGTPCSLQLARYDLAQGHCKDCLNHEFDLVNPAVLELFTPYLFTSHSIYHGACFQASRPPAHKRRSRKFTGQVTRSSCRPRIDSARLAHRVKACKDLAVRAAASPNIKSQDRSFRIYIGTCAQIMTKGPSLDVSSSTTREKGEKSLPD
jgi:hypothetical protein